MILLKGRSTVLNDLFCMARISHTASNMHGIDIRDTKIGIYLIQVDIRVSQT